MFIANNFWLVQNRYCEHLQLKVLTGQEESHASYNNYTVVVPGYYVGRKGSFCNKIDKTLAI